MADFNAQFSGNDTATFNARFTDNNSATFNARFNAVQEVISGDYNALYNKPSINDVELVGNKYCEDLGIFNLTNIQIKEIFDRVFRKGN